MQLSKAEVRQTWNLDRRRDRRRLVLLAGITLAAFLLCLLALFVDDIYHTKEDFIYELKILSLALFSGAALSVAGAIFQSAYRNPMASPNMLGSTAGVSLGNVLVIMLYSSAALEQIRLRYEFCYGISALCVLLVLLLGKLAGDRKENYSIMEMVMTGSVISQGISVFTMYIMYNLEDEDLLLYQQVSLGTYLQTDWASMAVFFIVMAISILPVMILRYRFNAIGMDRMESTSLGISTGPIRILGQVCGVTMVTCAMIHCGQVGMVSMVVPYIMRRAAGSDFRGLCIYSALTGGLLVVICRTLSEIIIIDTIQLPVTFLLNIILTPAFMVILAKTRGGRE